MASSVAPPRTKAEKKNEHFSINRDGAVEFGSSQRVEVRDALRDGLVVVVGVDGGRLVGSCCLDVFLVLL